MKSSIILTLLLSACSAAAAEAPTLTPIAVPGGGEGKGIGFDDLGFAPGLKKVVAPGGRTGKVFLIDPATRQIAAVAGFTAGKDYRGGHGEGVTSADEGRGLLFAADRNAITLSAVDPASGKTRASIGLRGRPDYVRYVAPTAEVWVTEPGDKRIEIFTVAADGKSLNLDGLISFPDGPESLVIDAERGRAYAHSWKDETFAIDLKGRSVVARWKNGCGGSRGIALDEKSGFVFVGCEEGKAVVLDAVNNGALLSSLKSGAGVDVIAYNPALRHLYLPGADSATMAVMAVSDRGALSIATTVKTAKDAHCVAADDRAGVWVCDPQRGRLLYLKDKPAANR